MKNIVILTLILFSNIFGQDFSYDWQRAEDFHNAEMYDSVLVYMPDVEAYLAEIGFEKQRMIALFYLANSNLHLHNFNLADSLYEIAIRIAEDTGEENKRKEIYYKRMQINSKIVNDEKPDSVSVVYLLDVNIQCARVLGITDVILSSIYEKALFYENYFNYQQAYNLYEELLYLLTRYLPRSAHFEKKVYFSILDNYVKLNKFEKVTELLRYKFFESRTNELSKYFEDLRERDKVAYKIIYGMIYK